MFTKIWKSKRFTQIVLMKRQDKMGEPELRFYFEAEGLGICEFGIGFKSDDDSEKKLNQAFQEMTQNEASQIISGWLAHMQKGNK
jgi:hypothetical protein